MQEIGPILVFISKRAPRWLAASVVLFYALVSLNLSDFGLHWQSSPSKNAAFKNAASINASTASVSESASSESAAMAEAIVLPGSAHTCTCHHEDGETCTMSCCASVAGLPDSGAGHKLCACDGPGSHRAKALIRLSSHLLPILPAPEFQTRAVGPVSKSEKSPLPFFPSPPEKIPISVLA